MTEENINQLKESLGVLIAENEKAIRDGKYDVSLNIMRNIEQINRIISENVRMNKQQ